MDPPFFARKETLKTIVSIAQSKRILVFVGAGVSIDQSNLTWRQLVEALAAKVHFPSQELARLFDVLDTRQVASVISQAYRINHKDRALEQLTQDIHSEIYGHGYWRKGHFATSVVLLLAEMHRAEADVVVVTTNYDQYLEAAMSQVTATHKSQPFPEFYSTALTTLDPADDVPDDDAASSSEISGTPVDKSRQIALIHAHGVVSDRADDSTSPYVVFGETDYYDSEVVLHEILEEHFRERDVLILGSSLNDPPLLRALAATREYAAESGLNRWAVYPRQAVPAGAAPFFGSMGGRLGKSTDLAVALNARAQAFGLRMIIPDFFMQAAQLTCEVARVVALDGSSNCTLDELCVKDKYYDRLNAWWNLWYNSRSTKTMTRQATDHRSLAAFLRSEIEPIVDDPNEGLKVDLWVRWMLDRNDQRDRELLLWASSTGTWPDHEIARRAALQAGSKYAAVQVFCSGRIEVVDTTDSSDRWARYIAVPLRYRDGADSLVVGVITLATTAVDSAKVNADNVDALVSLTEKLELQGRRMVSPRRRRKAV